MRMLHCNGYTLPESKWRHVRLPTFLPCTIFISTDIPRLATLAELKVEHERLQARLLSWKIQAQNSSHSSSPASSSSSLSNAHASSSLYATSSMVPAPQQGHAGSNAPLPPPQRAPEPSNYYYTSNTAPPGRYEDATRTAVKSNSDHGGGYNAGHTYGASPAEEEGLEEGTKKKKVRVGVIFMVLLLTNAPTCSLRYSSRKAIRQSIMYV